MPTHKVKKVIFELHGDEETLLIETQKQLSQGLQSFLRQSIEKVCNKYSNTDQLHLLDKVEIDIGVLDSGKGLIAFMKSFENTFEKVLKNEINQIPTEAREDWKTKDYQFVRDNAQDEISTDKRNRDIELLRYYVRSGMLPWWSEEEGNESLYTIFKQLLLEEREKVNQLLQELLHQPSYLFRLIQLIPEEQVEILTGIHPDWFSEFIELKKAVPYDQEFFRTQFLSTLLLQPTVVSSEFSAQNLATFLKAFKSLWPDTSNLLRDPLLVLEIWKSIESTLKKTSFKLDTNSKKYIANTGDLIWQNGAHLNKDRLFIQLLEQLKKETDKLNKKESIQDFTQNEIQHSLNLLADLIVSALSDRNKDRTSKILLWLSDNDSSDIKLLLSILKDTFKSEQLNEQWIDLEATISYIDQVELFKLVEEKTPKKRNNKTYNLLDGKIQLILKDRELGLDLLEKKLQLALNRGEEVINEHIEKQIRSKEHDHPLMVEDKLYIRNSGLVLLWPFIKRFFENLELLNKEGKFKSMEEAQRACILLQYIVEGEAMKPFEGVMPLNKLLCGIPLYQLVKTNDFTISNEEMVKADELLDRLLSGNTLWRSLSKEGLRSAYLQREGILYMHNGNWDLKIKKETHDITLSKLAWPLSIVKLPWMKRHITVEW